MKNKYRQSEDRAAELYGKRVSLSGAGVDKLDIDGRGPYENFKIENKQTDKNSYSINKEDFKKWRKQALLTGQKELLIRIDFGDLVIIGMIESTFKGNFECE